MRRRAAERMILSRRHIPVLAHFAASNVLVAFDYDGTLAPIVSSPSAARMRSATRRLLIQVAARYPCVVISGRRLDDLTKRLKRVPVWHLVGDHGFESRGATGAASAQVRHWVAQLRGHLPARKGLVIEQKQHSVTVHYRHVRDKRRVLELLADAAQQLRDARAIYSPEAINFLPNRGAHKGVALQQACRAFACDTAIYIGDDDTDEDAFASAGPERLLSIRVGTKRPSVAQYRLQRQADIDGLMKALIELRHKQAEAR